MLGRERNRMKKNCKQEIDLCKWEGTKRWKEAGWAPGRDSPPGSSLFSSPCLVGAATNPFLISRVGPRETEQEGQMSRTQCRCTVDLLLPSEVHCVHATPSPLWPRDRVRVSKGPFQKRQLGPVLAVSLCQSCKGLKTSRDQLQSLSAG